MGGRRRTYTAQAREHIEQLMARARQRGDPHIDVRAGDVHKELWPTANRTPVVCSAMYALMADDDLIIRSPPSGFGANLKIRYRLPRPSAKD